MKRVLIFGLLFMFIVFGFSINNTKAQSETDQILVDVSPENPGPFDNVSLSVSSYITDLDRANILWKLNDKQVLFGIGKKDFSFTVGDSGSTSKIDINIQTEEGDVITKRLYIRSSDLDVVWEAIDSYTPPFYKGKALPGPESFVKFYAIPNTKNISNKNTQQDIVYTWKQNFDSDTTSSGYGKNTFLMKFDYLGQQTNTISVNAVSKNRGYTATKSVSIKPYKPEIVLYPYTDEIGTYIERALGSSFSVTGKAKLIAVPYFFSPSFPLSNSLNYVWQINGADFPTGQAKNIINIESSGSGTAGLNISVTNENTYYQSAEKSANIEL